MAFPSCRLEHGREELVDDGPHRDSAELADADEPREAPELEAGAREAVIEDEAQAVGVAEGERAADAVHRGIDVHRVLHVEQIEQVPLADAQDLGAPLDRPVARGDGDGDVPVERLAVGRLHAARAHVELEGRPRAVPVEGALAGDRPAADPHLELAERDDVLLDLEVADERRDRHERRLDAGDREEAAAAEERVLVGEAEHRVRAALLVPAQSATPFLPASSVTVIGTSPLAASTSTPSRGHRGEDVVRLQRGAHAEERKVRRRDVRVERHRAAAREALGHLDRGARSCVSVVVIESVRRPSPSSRLPVSPSVVPPAPFDELQVRRRARGPRGRAPRTW